MKVHTSVVLCLSFFIFMFSGCASTTRTDSALLLEDPKTNTGLLTTEVRDDGLDLFAAALEERSVDRIQLAQADVTPSAIDSNDVTTVTRSPVVANSSGRLIQLPKLSVTELAEMLSSLQLRLELEKGYHPASKNSPEIPTFPDNVIGGRTLTSSAQSDPEWLQFGYLRYQSRPPELYLNGSEDNEDLAFIEQFITESVGLAEEMKRDLYTTDLEYQLVQLSHTDVDDALNIFKGLGITAFAEPSQVTFPIPFESLPVVIKMPVLESDQTKLIGEAGDKGTFGSSVSLSTYSQLPNNPNTSPDSQLLVYYHPAYPEQFSLVRRYLEEVIDRSARQVFVEGMVLEISEEGLKELGVQWEYQDGSWQWMLGSLEALDDSNSLFGGFDSAQDFSSEFQATIRALIGEGKAEVLSRPSILTLNNRQAVIRVGTDIPIATSQEGVAGNSNKLAFNFQYLPIGILLNIRPRIAENGSMVSMMIDIIVSDKVVGQDLELTDGNRVLASAPTVSSRRVQTYALIDNNTPFIIGGLVRKDNSLVEKKVPLLGDIPWIGSLFKSTDRRNTKAEVIIVLTPYVIDDTRDLLPKQYLPKDEDQFDSIGDELFRDSYRIRSEDVFDLSFLKENRRLQYYINLMQQAVKGNFRLKEEEPFNQFTEDGLIASHILVERMIYDVIKRLSTTDVQNDTPLDSRIRLDRLIFFQGRQQAGFEVEGMDAFLSNFGDGLAPESFFTENPRKALVMTFPDSEKMTGVQAMETGQIPQLSVIDCEDENEWSRLLWELNQPDDAGNSRSTIVLHSTDDLERLRRAVLLKKIVDLNGGKDELNLNRFSVGRMLRIPEISQAQRHVIDHTVAEYFFHTEHYYPALSKVIDEMLVLMDEAMEKPEFQILLQEVEQNQ